MQSRLHIPLRGAQIYFRLHLHHCADAHSCFRLYMHHCAGAQTNSTFTCTIVANLTKI
jgi:hypothetical protein